MALVVVVHVKVDKQKQTVYAQVHQHLTVLSSVAELLLLILQEILVAVSNSTQAMELY